MQLNLKNPIVFFDLETTGVNIATDRIVEISYLKVYPNGKEECKTLRINPGIPIPPESTAVHGISDADVANCPTYKEVAKTIAREIEGCENWLLRRKSGGCEAFEAVEIQYGLRNVPATAEGSHCGNHRRPGLCGDHPCSL